MTATNNGSTEEDDSSTNPYLALREAKIARNQARLQELGLLPTTERPATTRTKKPKTGSKPPSTTTEEEPVMLRRSNRLSSQPEKASWKEPSLEEVVRRRPKRPRAVAATTKSNTNGDTKASAPRPPPAANSVRAISIDPEILVLGGGGGQESGALGLAMEQTGKEFVIYESFDRAASEQDRQRLDGARLSFNKYSGVQEWKNVIFLWVNLGGKGGTVVNDFLDGGRQITWFGGSRMHDDTPVVQQLLSSGTTNKNKAPSSSSSIIVLWCRRYEQEKKNFSPYVCLGRLAYHSHVPGSYPLSFVWTLLDHDGLTTHSDESVRQTFQKLVGTTTIS